MGLDYVKKGRIAIFTINRPEAMNALDSTVYRELNDALKDFRDDPELWVGVLTGAGDKAFSAGDDLKDENLHKEWQKGGGSYEYTLMHGPPIFKPMIAAVNGYCLGGGLELALACDLRLASENARFGQPETNVGQIPAGGGTQRLPRMLHWCHAAEIIFMGQFIDAQEAYRIGLVNRVVPLEKLMPTALEWAEMLCQKAPLALQAAKEAMVRGQSMTLEDGLGLEREMSRYISGTEDFIEGKKAFAENRKPNYKGK